MAVLVSHGSRENPAIECGRLDREGFAERHLDWSSPHHRANQDL